MNAYEFIRTEDIYDRHEALRSIRILLLQQGYVKIPDEEDLSEMIESEIFQEGGGEDDLEEIVKRAAGQRGMVMKIVQS